MPGRDTFRAQSNINDGDFCKIGNILNPLWLGSEYAVLWDNTKPAGITLFYGGPWNESCSCGGK